MHLFIRRKAFLSMLVSSMSAIQAKRGLRSKPKRITSFSLARGFKLPKIRLAPAIS